MFRRSQIQKEEGKTYQSSRELYWFSLGASPRTEGRRAAATTKRIWVFMLMVVVVVTW